MNQPLAHCVVRELNCQVRALPPHVVNTILGPQRCALWLVVPQCFQVAFLPETSGFHQRRAVWVISRPPPICWRQEQHRPRGVCGGYGASGCAQVGMLLLLLSPCMPMLWLYILPHNTGRLCHRLPSNPTSVLSVLLALLLRLDQWKMSVLLLTPLLTLWPMGWHGLRCHVPHWHWV